ncbi:hypothetical protein AciX8_1481 [Granulicella mallensis MP5ACTX8]|uniref:Uncharacterized protein n=1 Tax=Granulicella mallensis (strain ATCC BAA-1857 / DSM 23137 / MP5ACTX8) TaxID=682795 RepID=G8P0X6_GRAMM|nr:hypothetical protein AciX8_1481 [Granulicella mallensis MP5ACTX8]
MHMLAFMSAEPQIQQATNALPSTGPITKSKSLSFYFLVYSVRSVAILHLGSLLVQSNNVFT